MKKKWISGGVIALYLVCLIGCEKYGQPHQEELESQSDAESYSVVSEMSNEDSDIENSEGEYGMLTIEDVRRLAEKHDTLTLQDLEPYMDDTFGIQNNKMTELPFIYEGKEYYLRVVSDFGELNAIVVFDKEFLELKTMEDEYAYQGGCADIRAGVLEHILSGTVTMEDYMTFELPGELVQSRFCHWMGTRGGIIFLTGEDEQKLKLENTGLYAVVDQNHPLRGGIEIKGRGETEAVGDTERVG